MRPEFKQLIKDWLYVDYDTLSDIFGDVTAWMKQNGRTAEETYVVARMLEKHAYMAKAVAAQALADDASTGPVS